MLMVAVLALALNNYTKYNYWSARSLILTFNKLNLENQYFKS